MCVLFCVPVLPIRSPGGNRRGGRLGQAAPDDILLGKLLGAGSFGRVYAGKLVPNSRGAVL